MKIASIVLLTCTIVSAQSLNEIHQRYGQPVSETYNVRGTTVTINYSKTGEVCKMQIEPLTKTENGKPSFLKTQLVDQILGELVPPSKRGKYLMGTFINAVCLPDNDCFGTELDYERVTIFYNGGTDAHRLAGALWKSQGCDYPKPRQAWQPGR